MAGGRRPANFAAGTATRHAASDRDAVTAASYYSIWQQPHLQPTASPPGPARPTHPPVIPALDSHRLAPLPQYAATTTSTTAAMTTGAAASRDPASWPAASGNPSGALAAALDSAVAVAVHRALSSRDVLSPSYRTGTQQEDEDHALSVASSSFNHVVGSGSRSSSVSGDRDRERDRDVAGIVDLHIEAESQERKREFQELRSLVEKLETRFAESEAAHASSLAALESRIASAEAAARQARKESLKHASDAAALREQLRAVNKALADTRAQKQKADSDGDRLRSRVAHLEAQADSFGETLSPLQKRIEFVEATANDVSEVRGQLEKATAAGKDVAIMFASAEKVVQTSNEALEATSGLRARLKRLETSVDVTGKRVGESLALQGGAVDGLRLCVTETATSVQALKRLVEANLRSHSSAEGIVKDQAQLITRHVCVALRQFIARRISDNNLLIDKALRARVPAYAEAGEEFVLVREHDADPEDEGDATSTPLESHTRRASATVLPREVFDQAIADFDAKGEVGSEKT